MSRPRVDGSAENEFFEEARDVSRKKVETSPDAAEKDPVESDGVKPTPVSQAVAADNNAIRVRPEANRALSLMAARGFRAKMLRWRRQLEQINAMEPMLVGEDDHSLKKRSLALRYRAMAGEKLATLLPEAYAARYAKQGVELFRCDTTMFRSSAVFPFSRVHCRNADWRGQNVDGDLAALFAFLVGERCPPRDGQ